MESLSQARQPVTENFKSAIAAHLSRIEPDKRGALVILVDESGPRAHLAARLNNIWKVGFEAGKPWNGPVTGQIMIAGSW